MSPPLPLFFSAGRMVIVDYGISKKYVAEKHVARAAAAQTRVSVCASFPS